MPARQGSETGFKISKFSNVTNSIAENSDDCDSNDAPSKKGEVSLQKLREFIAKKFLNVSLSQL
jgi:hypothetical protein